MSWPNMAHTVARAVIVSIFRSSTALIGGRSASARLPRCLGRQRHSRCSITEQTLSASSILQYIRKVANNPDQWNFCSRVHLVIALCLIEWVAADVVQCEGKVCISIFPRLLQKCTSLHHPNVCRFPDDHSLARTGSRPVVASQQAENLSAVTRKAFRSCRHEDSLCTWLRAHCTGHVQTR